MDKYVLNKRINHLLERVRKKNADEWPGPKPKGCISAPTACQVVKVLVEEGVVIKKGEPVFVLNLPVPSGSIPSDQAKRNMKKYLDVRTGLSIYSMKDVIVNLDDPVHNPMEGLGNEDDFIRRYQNFEKFDTVVDHSDHLFSAQSSLMEQPSIDWANKIHEEWSILKEHLPETVFVRAYEDRMDLLKAVIIGPQGTPYHDGLFFFDVCFPRNYPYSPPLVRSLSHVLGSNPECGEVGSFLKNIASRLEKTWVPGTSNVLEYLVSIQDLILTAKPLFHALPMMSHTAGESLSLLYNENIIVKSLKTMVCTMMKPPMHFEVFVAGHFCERANDILMACKSYKDGLQVGCLVSSNNQTSSNWFKKDVGLNSELLVKAFKKIGEKVVENSPRLIETKTTPPLAYAQTSVAGGEDIDVAVKKKRKVTFDLGVDDAGKKKRKFQEYYHRLPCAITAPSAFKVGKVLVEEGAEVERGQPLCMMGPFKHKGIVSSTATQTIKKILERNQSSRVGIFSMEDTLVDRNHNLQMEGLDNEDVLKRYQNFSKFDTAVDHSDHFFSKRYAMNQSKEWVDKIHEEWRMLAENLPETILVRVYEDRMDLLRGVIIGPHGTPYDNGLFFFDVCFPRNYPNSPPLVHYRSGGLGINPNLYKCGRVDLILPKASGVGQQTMWDLGNTTILQLLVSIQDRIFNKNPLYHDITYSILRGSSYGEQSSILYNQNTVIKTLKTMEYTIKNPPKNFEIFVVGHFRNCVNDILMSCKKETGSVTFKNDLDTCINQLLFAFIEIGAQTSQNLPSS